MSITFKNNMFHLRSKNTSYILGVLENKLIVHLYWGKKFELENDLMYIPNTQIFSRASSFSPPLDENKANDDRIFTEDIKLEFSTFGSGDYREPSFQALYNDGSTVSEFIYDSYKIIEGKPLICGLPSTYTENCNEAQTLEVTLIDKLSGLKAVLSYSVFPEYDIITRSIRYENAGANIIKLTNVMSCCVDFSGMDYKLLHLQGAWGRERDMEFLPVSHGTFKIDSKRGFSGHSENPFLALMDTDAEEYHGNVYGFSLVYSGNFIASCESATYDSTRILMGINPYEFMWNLNVGEIFCTPEVVLSYSDKGLDGISKNYHKLYRERLCRGKYRDSVRPIVINNWEGTYFDFNEEKLLGIAKEAKDVGIEMFVLDDGWFGERNDDTTSLGDWVVNKEKLPNGLDSFIDEINKMGMKFGLWFEPEMISPISKIYKEHPDWCLHIKDRKRTTARNQLVLDLTRKDVRDYIVGFLTNIISTSNIEYIKWDCNRNFTEIGSELLPPECGQEISHRYMLGLYEILEKITTLFPNVLFEGCSGGGGRFDPGMLYYMPQSWCSDNTDAMDRINIQFGTSVVYPPVTMGAHIGEGGMANRNVSITSRSHVAMMGAYGYEVDLTQMSKAEKNEIAEQIITYKKLRKLLHFSNYHRLESPFDGRFASWQFVNDDKTDSVVFMFQKVTRFNDAERCVKLKDLIPSGLYECSDGKVYSGEVLMNIGYSVKQENFDYMSVMRTFKLRIV